MTREELERRLNEAEKQNLGLLDEIKRLKEKLAEQEKEPEIPDFPEFDAAGEEAWHINNVLEVSTPGIASGHIKDYNYFHSNEYAQEFAKKCKLIAMMLHCKWYLDRYYTPNWDILSVEKYSVVFCHNLNEFQVRTQYGEEHGDVYFSTEEAAQKCADWMNEHWEYC